MTSVALKILTSGNMFLNSSFFLAPSHLIAQFTSNRCVLRERKMHQVISQCVRLFSPCFNLQFHFVFPLASFALCSCILSFVYGRPPPNVNNSNNLSLFSLHRPIAHSVIQRLLSLIIKFEHLFRFSKLYKIMLLCVRQ